MFSLSKESRSKLAFWGTGVAAVVAGLWTGFVYLYPPKNEVLESKQVPSSNQVGTGNINNNGNNNTFNYGTQQSQQAANNETDTYNKEYIVCIGENAGRCPSGSVYLPCGSSEDAWANNECKSFRKTVLSDVSGGHCGYYTTSITCSISVKK